MFKLFWFFVIYLTSTPARLIGPKACTDENGKPGNCVEIQNCPKTQALIANGKLTERDFQYLDKVRCGFAGSKIKVCCEIAEAGELTFVKDQIIEKKLEKFVIPSLQAEDGMQPTHKECAFTGSNFRVSNGKATDLGEYQFAALLHKPNRFYCGGSLINHWYVLTAAHCLSEKPDFVRLGEWKISSDKDCDPEEPNLCSDPVKDIEVDTMIAHEDYDPSSFENDVGLLRLKQRVEYTDWIKPVCLPRSREEVHKLAFGQKIVTMGWGRINGSSSHQSDTLLKADIEIYKHNHCFQKLEVTLEISQFCAGSEDGRDSCGGDSGGPIIIKTGSKPYYLQIGIVSAGNFFCGMKGLPSVYSNVAAFMDWIDDKM